MSTSTDTAERYTIITADSHAGGVRIALALMASGAARKKVDQFVKFTRTS